MPDTERVNTSNDELRDKLLAGKPIHFQQHDSQKTRTIPSDWIEEAATKNAAIDLRNVRISGALRAQGISFPAKVSMIDCHFEAVDFSYARFKRSLVLSGTVFDRGITFQSATAESDITLDGARIQAGEANFTDLHVQGGFSAIGLNVGDGVNADFTRVRMDKYARFWGAIYGGGIDFDHAVLAEGDFRGTTFKQKANFNPSKIDGGVFFRAYPEKNMPAAKFEGEVNFGGAEIGLTADFAGVQFSGEDKIITFESSKINGNVVFDDAKFAGPASFADAKITSYASFRGVSFEREANFTGVEIDRMTDFSGSIFEKKLSFNSAKIGGSAFFQPAAGENGAATFFKGEVDFVSANIGLVAVFDSAEFTNQEEGVTFESSKIGGNAFFRNAHFAGTTSFIRCEIGSTAAFDGAKFDGEKNGAKNQVNFDGARIAGDASFRGSVFAGPAVFISIQINGTAVFTGAVFKNDTSFNSADIKGLASFRPEGDLKSTRFEGEVDFIGAKFSFGVDFRGAQFTAPYKSVNFDNATFGGDTYFSGATFGGETQPSSDQERTTLPEPVVNFRFARFAANAYFDGVQFSVADKPTRFDLTKVDGNISFHKAIFAGEASFNFMKIEGYVQFQGAEFTSTEKAVSFDGANIGGTAFFSEKKDVAAFRGQTSFTGVYFGGYAVFTFADFSCSHKSPCFDEAVFSSQTSFDQASFSAGATFTGAEFRGPATFQSTKFLGVSKKNDALMTSFVGTEFQQGSYFNDAIFDHRVDFRAAQFDVEASFQRVEFREKANFAGAHFSGSANFSHDENSLRSRTIFTNLSLKDARFENAAKFEDAVFAGPVQLEETSFGSVFFSPTGKVGEEQQFKSTVDLRGCTYERIEVDWQSLLRQKDEPRVEPYDRQPYMQLEKAFHSTGRDLVADQVYLERQHVERKRYFSSARSSPFLAEKLQRTAAWFFSFLYWRLLNYGVRPYRLIVFTTLLLLIGTGTFLEPGAVTQKAAKPNDPPTYVSLLPKEAFQLSLKEFLPIELPMASQWNPSEEQVNVRIRILKWTPSLKVRMRASVFATFLLKIPGWILVPLGVGALTGLLRFRAKP